MKEATAKDVVYALQWGGETLIQEAGERIGSGMSWRLSSGALVSPKTAAAVTALLTVVTVSQTRSRVVYGWRKAAA